MFYFKRPNVRGTEYLMISVPSLCSCVWKILEVLLTGMTLQEMIIQRLPCI
jgi:hypothetical protein